MSIAFVPPKFAKDAIVEAIDAKIPLLVVITEESRCGTPPTRWAYNVDHAGTRRIIGPNCPESSPRTKRWSASPRPPSPARTDRPGVRSPALTYQMMYELRDFGFSTAIGIGGDGHRHHPHRRDRGVRGTGDQLIVMIGEIGGDAEGVRPTTSKANVTKPVVGYVAGFTAPEGKTMGHASAIVSRVVGHRRREGGPRGRRGEGRQDALGHSQVARRSCGACDALGAVPVTTVDPRTPVVVGVRQFTERIDGPGYRGMSSVELASAAASTALADYGDRRAPSPPSSTRS